VEISSSDSWMMGMDIRKGSGLRERNQTLFHIKMIIKAEQWMKPWRQSVDREEKEARVSAYTASQRQEKETEKQLEVNKEAKWDQGNLL